MGVIGKIHNLVIYIHALPNYTNKFKALSGKIIPLGNRTRWNSWFRMLYVTLKTEVLNALRNYTEAHINKGTIDKRDELTPSNIALCRTIEQFLSIFKSATLFLKGQQATIERVLKVIEIIKEHLEISLVCRTIILITFTNLSRKKTDSLKIESNM